MAARRMEISLRPGDTVIVHVPQPGDDGAKVRTLADMLADLGTVDVYGVHDGFTVEVFDGQEVRAHGWVNGDAG